MTNTNTKEHIIQIAAVCVHIKETDKDLPMIYALTNKGIAYEYLNGMWVELNPINDNTIGIFKDGKLVKKK